MTAETLLQLEPLPDDGAGLLYGLRRSVRTLVALHAAIDRAAFEGRKARGSLFDDPRDSLDQWDDFAQTAAQEQLRIVDYAAHGTSNSPIGKKIEFTMATVTAIAVLARTVLYYVDRDQRGLPQRIDMQISVAELLDRLLEVLNTEDPEEWNKELRDDCEPSEN